MLVGVLAGCVSSPRPAVGDGPPAQDPAPPRSIFSKLLCDGGCLKAMTRQTGDANEVMLQIDASNPMRLMAGAKEYPVRHMEPLCATVAFYASDDGGRTWRDGYPRPHTGPFGGPNDDRCESDPVVAFDGRGNSIFFSLSTSKGLWTYRTRDHGATWSEVTMAYRGVNDKNWAATDYARHRIYAITRLPDTGAEAVTYSDDAGDTWEGPFRMRGVDLAQIEVGPDGTLYALGRETVRIFEGIRGQEEGWILFTRSEDAGRTWSHPVQIARARPAVQTAFGGTSGYVYRAPIVPDIAVARSTGAIYGVWHDRGPDGSDDVWFVASRDRGDTWSKPLRVNDDVAAAPQIIPAVAASPAGDAHVVFFDGRHDPTRQGHLYDVHYAHSLDGIAFDRNLRVTPEPFSPYLSRHQGGAPYLGDYIGIEATNETAVAAFPVSYGARSAIKAAIIGG